MATINLSAPLDMSAPDPLGLGAYASNTTDVFTFLRYFDDANNYTEFTGNLLLTVTGVTKVVNGVTVLEYTGGSVNAAEVMTLTTAGAVR